MHYVRFLMDHGREPYRDITDMNMPGAYLAEGWAMHLFGGGDVAWRVYDFSLMLVMTAAMVVIARPYDWFAGLFAGLFFSLMHGLEGPLNAAQRDLVMTVLLVAGYAFLFEGLRRRWSALVGLFGLCAGMAAAIKPTVGPFALVLLGAAMAVARRRGMRWGWYGVWGLAGLGVAGAIVAGFLLQHHALGDFLYILRTVIPQYAGLDKAPFGTMMRQAVPLPALLMLAPAAWLAWRHRSWREWETVALWAGAVAGFLSYYAQRKGYVYHRYMMVAFLLLWIMIELGRALRERGGARWVAVAGFAVCTLFADTRYLHGIYRLMPEEKFGQYARTLEGDLSLLGTERLQGQVECLDMVYGCMNALYHLGIVQNTGATGDMLYFLPSERPVVLRYREMFWRELQARPPAVFVISNQWYAERNTFAKVDAWPLFAGFLRANYVMVKARAFEGDGKPPADPGTRPTDDAAYQIWVRRGSDVMAAAARLP